MGYDKSISNYMCMAFTDSISRSDVMSYITYAQL